jgi:hypothetical protein
MRKKFASPSFLLACLAAATVAWYFGMYLPRNGAMENSRRCSEDGLRFSSDYQRDLESAAPNSDRHFLKAETHFSRKMNTCLVEIKWDEMLRDELGRSAVVVDVYGSHEIISTHDSFEHSEPEQPAQGASDPDPKKYREQKDELFRQ